MGSIAYRSRFGSRRKSVVREGGHRVARNGSLDRNESTTRPGIHHRSLALLQYGKSFPVSFCAFRCNGSIPATR
jgi:hypothetical protein